MTERKRAAAINADSGEQHDVRLDYAAAAPDVVEAMRRDLGRPIRSLRVDGGACQNDLLMQFQSDLVDAALVRPKLVETTAAGAACLAGLGVKLWSPSDLGRLRATGQVFRPRMAAARRRSLLFGWHHAVAQARLRA